MKTKILDMKTLIITAETDSEIRKVKKFVDKNFQRRKFFIEGYGGNSDNPVNMFILKVITKISKRDNHES